MILTKKCSKCNRIKVLSKFGDDSRYRLGVKGRCKLEYGRTPKARKRRRLYLKEKMQDSEFREAQRIRSSEKYHKNPKKQKARIYRRKYRISLKKFERTKKCILCKRRVRLVADHDHKTDKYRGALCHICNLMIAWFERIPGAFKKIREYLKRG